MSSKDKKNKESEWFGYEQVDPKDKAGKVQDVFDSVADQYDIMNDVMSGGMHRLWKDALIRMISPRADKALLDLAGGTGDVSFRYRKKAGDKSQITVCDINENMLNVGQDRAIDKGILNGMDWIVGDAQDLPFEDNSFDVCTIVFGLRNVPKIDDALAQIYRVLKPGGQFFCMEFSKVKTPILEKIYDTYSFKILPKMGEIIAKDRESYQYLAESIRQFPPQEELAERMKQVGFEHVKYRNLTGGIVAIHNGHKA